MRTMLDPLRSLTALLILGALFLSGCARATPEQIARLQELTAEAHKYTLALQAQRDEIVAALPEIRAAVARAEEMAASTGSPEAVAMAKAARARLEAALATVERYQHLADVAAQQAQRLDEQARSAEAGTPWWQIAAGLIGAVAAGLGGARALPGTGRIALKLLEGPAARVQLAREVLLQQTPLDPDEVPTDRVPRGSV